MNESSGAVTSTLNRAEFRFQWLQWLRICLDLGCGGCLLLLLVGLCILSGWIQSRALAMLLVGGIVAGAVASSIIAGIWVLSRRVDREWLARAVEREEPGLLDRFNTLVFLLRPSGPSPSRQGFERRIWQQSRELLSHLRFGGAFSLWTLRWHGVLCAGAVILTVGFYKMSSPGRLLTTANSAGGTGQSQEHAPELTLPPASSSLEQRPDWGEVRITEPGCDLRVTKVDAVALQIEAAANRPWKAVSWSSAVNGGAETEHPLPPPAEPQFAVYQPVLYLDELQLSDWDVVTYFARAGLQNGGSYGSDVYFLEVRPFREDILKMPGGEGGKAYASVNGISALIHQQQQVVRQTYQYLAQPADVAALQEQTQRKLAAAEQGVREATQHLYAQMAAELENKPIGVALDNLAKARQSLDRAASLLQEKAIAEAREPERRALSDLVAARKSFQKAVSEHGSDFAEPQSEESSPVAESGQKLSRMAEFRDEAKAAREFVRQTAEGQKQLNTRLGRLPRSQYPNLSEQEAELDKGLKDFQEQHPRVFKDLEPSSQQAHAAMAKAAQALRNRSPESAGSAAEAAEQLQTLGQKLDEQDKTEQLTAAYRLKQMLDQQAQTLNQRAQNASAVDDKTLRDTALQTRKTLQELERLAAPEPEGQSFGNQLRQALAGSSRAELDRALEQLQKASAASDQTQAAKQAQEHLAGISKAFEQSQPQGLREAQQQEQESDRNGLAQGMTELQSLLREVESQKLPSSENQEKQIRQALFDLREGLKTEAEKTQPAKDILAHVEQKLQSPALLEGGGLRRLLEELDQYSIELAEARDKRKDTNRIAHIEPRRLPPAYREQIERYFKSLSER